MPRSSLKQVCPGCNRSFANTHLHQRQAPAGSRCHLVLLQRNESIRNDLRGGFSHVAVEPVLEFTGDFIGDDYGMADFGMDEDVGMNDGMGHDDTGDSETTSGDEQEQVWERFRAPAEREIEEQEPEDEDERRRLGEVVVERRAAQARLQYRPVRTDRYNDIVRGGQAGKTYGNERMGSHHGHAAHAEFAENLRAASIAQGPHAPFSSKLDWDMACWAKTRGPGSNALNELLRIDGVVDLLGLTYRNSRELNAIVDTQIPTRRPVFRRRGVAVGETVLDLYSRDAMECIRALFGAPEFADELILQPERHYVDEEGRVRVYHDMHTGDWWWDAQHTIETREPGGTVVPVIISLDKTQVTLFRTKSAYPVYLTIANIPKDHRKKPSRHAQVLLAYLPTSRLQHVDIDASRRRMLSNTIHACLRFVFRELRTLGRTGTHMRDGNGLIRRCHPIIASIVVDYQEQVQIAGIITGDCAKCKCRYGKLGDDWKESFDMRDMRQVREIMNMVDTDEAGIFNRVCKENRIKPIQGPFWIDLPYIDVFHALTPDVLHQLHQGVVKHLIEWLTVIIGKDELDARCRRIPPSHGIRVFHMGLSVLSRVSGTEHAQICQFLLGLLSDFRLQSAQATRQLVRATRAILDFVYIAQYPIHTDKTLALLDDALERFHANKQVFIDEGARDDFNFVKLHSMVHYGSSIKDMGTTDNYNTQSTERLHIDFAKDAYAATNHKDELPQMTRWLERKEKVFELRSNISWQTERFATNPPWKSPEILPDLQVSTAKNRTRNYTIADLSNLYGADCFDVALARYAVSLRHPNMRQRNIETAAHDEIIIVRLVSVFERVKFRDRSSIDRPVVDSIHASPCKRDRQGREVPGRFDTALVRIREGTGIQCFRVAQVRVIFSLNERALAQLFTDEEAHLRERVPPRLAYVQWFTKFAAHPDVNFRMYKTSRSLTADGTREFSIIPVSELYRSAHLIPRFTSVAPQEWTSSNVLEKCFDFYLNDFKDRSTHFSLF